MYFIIVARLVSSFKLTIRNQSSKSALFCELVLDFGIYFCVVDLVFDSLLSQLEAKAQVLFYVLWGFVRQMTVRRCVVPLYHLIKHSRKIVDLTCCFLFFECQFDIAHG